MDIFFYQWASNVHRIEFCKKYDLNTAEYYCFCTVCLLVDKYGIAKAEDFPPLRGALSLHAHYPALKTLVEKGLIRINVKGVKLKKGMSGSWALSFKGGIVKREMLLFESMLKYKHEKMA